MIRYKKIILSVIAVLCSHFTFAQSEDTAIYSDFEKNYNDLLQSYYIKQNEKLLNKNFSGTTYGTHKASQISDEEYQRRLKAIPSCVNLVYNSTVRNHIIYYVDRIGDRLSVMLGMSKYYFPIFENILDAYGVPSDMKYIVIIESALNPKAVSRAGATGLWQFMYSTGRTYDLRVNSIVDDRRDPIKSTVAAAKYLKDLYSMYHDWALVLAAYNAGPGNVNKAMKRSGKNNFWEICPYLPKETRNYVPAFIAATYAMNYAGQHGIYPADLTRPLDLINDTVNVSKDIYFGQIEKVMGLSVEQIREMNPQYKMDYIPGTTGEYSLRLPLKDINTFIETEDSISNTDKDKYNPSYLAANGSLASVTSSDGTTETVYVIKNITHKVQGRDSWSSVAKRYGVSVADLRKWNKKIKTNKLRKGTLLTVKQRVAVENKKYIAQNPQEKESIVQESTVSADNENNQQEKVSADAPKTTDNKKQNVENKKQNTAKTKQSSDRQKQNTDTKKASAQKQSAKTHTVKEGENLSKIAAKYKTSVSQIMKLNGLDQKSADKLRPGQKIKVK